MLGLSAVAGMSAPAQASVVLTLEGVGDGAFVNDFYNGGTDSDGNSGINYGIDFLTFGSIGLIDSDVGGSGDFANEPSPETVLLVAPSAWAMNVAAGFETGFSLFYSAASSFGGTVEVYDGLNGTGNLLGSLTLVPNSESCSGDPNGVYCEWTPVGMTFAGTAHSVDFDGFTDFLIFDNITFGAATPGNGNEIPEPATWAMMLLGFGAMGIAIRRSRKMRPIPAIA